MALESPFKVAMKGPKTKAKTRRSHAVRSAVLS